MLEHRKGRWLGKKAKKRTTTTENKQLRKVKSNCSGVWTLKQICNDTIHIHKYVPLRMSLVDHVHRNKESVC